MSVTNTPSINTTTNTRARAKSRYLSAPEDLFNDFLLALDPRGDSKNSKLARFALATSDDNRFREFLERLGQPRYQRWSLAAMARSCDISFGEFVVFWQRAQVEGAIAIMSYAAPDAARSLVAAALGREVVCEKCQGLGWLPVEAWIPPEDVPGYRGRVLGHPQGRAARTCPYCDGAGKVDQPGDQRAIDRVLEIAGIIGKNRPAVRIVQNFSGASHAEAMRELSGMSIDVSDESAEEE